MGNYLDQVALGVEAVVDSVFSSPRRVVGDDSHGVFVCNHLAQAIGVMGSVAMTTLAGNIPARSTRPPPRTSGYDGQTSRASACRGEIRSHRSSRRIRRSKTPIAASKRQLNHRPALLEIPKVRTA